jgi:hypothetical protein
MAPIAVGLVGVLIVAWNVYWWRAHARRRERAGLTRQSRH